MTQLGERRGRGCRKPNSSMHPPAYTKQSPGGKLEGSVNSNNHTCMYEKVYPGDSGGVIGTPSKDVFEWDM